MFVNLFLGVLFITLIALVMVKISDESILKERLSTSARVAILSFLIIIGVLLLKFPAFPVLPDADYLLLEFSAVSAVLIYFLFNYSTSIVAIFTISLNANLIYGSSIEIPIDQIALFTACAVFVTSLLICDKHLNLFSNLKYINKITICMLIAVLTTTVFMTISNYLFFTPLYYQLLGIDTNFVTFSRVFEIYVPYNFIKYSLVSVLSIPILTNINLLMN